MEYIKIGLAGNPNVGKTSLFNGLTGFHQHVGNWPGKTVEKAEGTIEFNNSTIDIVDLPGNYALTAHSIEEIVSRDFIVDDDSDLIVNVLDAQNLERNLYLTVQMMELNSNLVIALNMNELAKKNDFIINSKKLSQLLGVPVVEIEANSDKGRDELLSTVKKVSVNKVKSISKLAYGNELKEHIKDLSNIIEEDESLLDVPSFWTSLKLLENDEAVLKKVASSKYSNKILNELAKIKKHLMDVFGESPEEIIANNRYAFIDGLIKETVVKPKNPKPSFTEKVDRIVTNRFLGIPIFLGIMYLLFQLTFAIGTPLSDLLDGGFALLGEFIVGSLGETALSSFLVDGIIGGVGGVLVFIPQIFLMFLFISFLEDSGYLARAAFVMDRVMHKFLGLHGKAFIPMILGFGCGVPGILATRTMEHEKDRLLTMLVLPFMSCTARLPVYILFVEIFFSTFQGEVIFSLYLLGIVVAIIVAAILKKAVFKGISTPFVMELPSYKLPTLKGILIHSGEKSWGFIKKAGTIILAAAIVVWILSSLPFGVDYGSQGSLIGQIGTFFAPIFSPLGFGNWQASVSLIFGMVAKEVVVGTFTSLFGVVEGSGALSAAISGIFTPLSAYSFMVFVLLYIPCFAALGTIRQETNSWKWPAVMVAVTTITAYIVSFLIYQGGLLLGFV